MRSRGAKGKPIYVPEFDPGAHEYRWEGKVYIGATKLLTITGLWEFFHADPVTMAEALKRGKLVHAATVQRDDGEPVTLESEYMGYLCAYDAFRETNSFMASPSWTELPLCDPALGIAGTPDRVGYFGPKLTEAVLDIKTGDVHPSIGIQLAIYRHLLAVNGFPVVHRLGLHLRADGTFRLYEYTEPGDHAAFLAALAIYRWRQKAQAA